jgi:hypothetical protein
MTSALHERTRGGSAQSSASRWLQATLRREAIVEQNFDPEVFVRVRLGIQVMTRTDRLCCSRRRARAVPARLQPARLQPLEVASPPAARCSSCSPSDRKCRVAGSSGCLRRCRRSSRAVPPDHPSHRGAIEPTRSPGYGRRRGELGSGAESRQLRQRTPPVRLKRHPPLRPVSGSHTCKCVAD